MKSPVREIGDGEDMVEANEHILAVRNDQFVVSFNRAGLSELVDALPVDADIRTILSERLQMGPGWTSAQHDPSRLN